MTPPCVLCVAVLVVALPPAATLPAARTPAVIRRELVEAQAWLAQLEAELLRAEDIAPKPLTIETVRVGHVGYFNDGSYIATTTRTTLRLYRRLGPQEALIGVVVCTGTIPRVVVRGIPVADLATDSLICKPDLWRVAGTRDLGDETLFVIEPYASPGRKPGLTAYTRTLAA